MGEREMLAAFGASNRIMDAPVGSCTLQSKTQGNRDMSYDIHSAVSEAR